jgi:hypothetical protein
MTSHRPAKLSPNQGGCAARHTGGSTTGGGPRYSTNYNTNKALKSLTLVNVGPVCTRSPRALKNG